MSCNFCSGKIGKEFNLKRSPASIEFQPDKAFIIQGNNEKAGIVLLNKGLAQGCFKEKCEFRYGVLGWLNSEA